MNQDSYKQIAYGSETDLMIINHLMGHASVSRTPWELIYESDPITRYFQREIEILKRDFLWSKNESVPIGKMLPSAFHQPFLRLCGKDAIIGLTIYRVLEGSLKYVQDEEMKVANVGDTVCVEEGALFSFQAGVNGCKFAIIMTPEFKPDQFTNEII